MSEQNNGLNAANEDNTPHPNYWRSFESLYNDPTVIEAKAHEFKAGVTDDFSPSGLSSISRRKFIALLGASAALAGTSCTDYRDKGEIVPYNVKPEEITVGKPNYYASTCTACPNACGILIKTREGRPIKIDGNPDHPVNKGKICAKGQANILNLYDPERVKTPQKNIDSSFTEVSWKDADNDIITALGLADKGEIALISHTIVSPTMLKVIEDFKTKYPTTKLYSYELFNDSVKNSAWRKTHGSGNYPLLKWDEAKIILSLESDFLGTEENKVENSRMYSQNRDVDNKKFTRLYCADSSLTITGINSDYRLRIDPAAQLEFVLSLTNEIVQKGNITSAINASNYDLNSFAKKYNLDSKILNHLVSDLISNKGKSIITAGNALSENVHIAVNLLNDALGNKNLFRTDASSVTLVEHSTVGEFEELVQKMNNDSVAVIVNIDCNPVYHFAKDLGFEKALSKVPLSVTLTERFNETTAVTNYTLPLSHNFESWGDAQVRTNVISLQQPVISPIHKTRQKESIFLTWISGKSDSFTEYLYLSYLKNNWEKNIYPTLNSKINFEKFWLGALHDGIVETNSSAIVSGEINSGTFDLAKDEQRKSKGLTLIIKENYSLGDGRFAHNGWLQELPHPVSKATWDNYAALSEKTCKDFGLKDNDLIEVKVENRKLILPVFMQAGTADNVIVVESGYGRTNSGIVATGVGFNVNSLLSAKSDLSPWIYNNASITKTGDKYLVATTQEHHAFDDPLVQDLHIIRKIIQEGTVTQYLKNPSFIKESNTEQLPSVSNPYPYNGVKWGMAIDLNKCTGCGDCIVACDVENNIPVVGKDQVLKSREMQWLRIDRYYSGSPDNPKVSVQPMLCQHCDQAPCENVCPVVATTHSPDGLNQMTYNRCVGTRYCSNNCPYKVRRFNFYNFRDHFRDSYQENPILALMHNPEVTVRSRGVMEKCTFCVQRISEAKADATHQKRNLKGSDVTTACQDSCGSNAIYFGDINDKESEFYKYRNHELGYYVLEELNVKPNVTYIAKLRNIHSEEV